MEKLARDKRYSLIRKSVTYGQKKFFNIELQNSDCQFLMKSNGFDRQLVLGPL